MCGVVWLWLGVCVWIRLEEVLADRACFVVAQTFANKLQLQSLCRVILNSNGVFFFSFFSFFLKDIFS